MNIAHLIVSLNRGGQERVVVDLASEQVKNGNSVSIICLNEEGVLANEAREKGINILFCKKRSAIDLNAISQAKKYLLKYKVEILHTHNATSNYYGVLAKIGTRVKCQINTRHNNGPIHGKLVEFLFYISTFFTHLCVCVAETARQNFIKERVLSFKNSIVVYNGIHTNHISISSETRSRIRNEFNINDAYVFGSVGRLSDAKDFPFLVEAFSILTNKIPRTIKLLIVGEGDERKKIEESIRKLNMGNYVQLLGDRSDAREILTAFDAYVVSSATEGFSISILEACAAKLPIIATNVGGNSEIIKDRERGLLVEHGNADALANAMLKILENNEYSKKLSLAAYTWVNDNCSVEKMYNSYFEIYSQCVD